MQAKQPLLLPPHYSVEKTDENRKTCQICQQKFTYIHSLSRHVQKIHNITKKNYYDLFFKTINEGKCLNCQKETGFFERFVQHSNGLLTHYKLYCSVDCQHNDKNLNACTQRKREQTHLKRYGIDNPFKSKQLQDQIQVQNINKYGTPYLLCVPEILKKIKNTNKIKYGHEYVTNAPSVQQKMKETLLKNYGVLVPCQNNEIQQKSQHNAKRLKEYILPSGKKIQLQGYEPQFLDYIFKENLLKEEEIICGFKQIPHIIYYDNNNRKHYYFPDFYIPKWNLIIEIKSQWTLTMDKQFPFKIQGTRLKFDMIIIIDNNFNSFREYVQNRIK